MEQTPQPPRYETVNPVSPEAQPSQPAESLVNNQETRERVVQSDAGDPAADISTITLPQPVVPDDSTATTAASITQPINDDNPLVAADNDLIEKEWVDRAKHIVNSTKDDPYRQEQEVSRMQADYLKKRFGKEIKVPTD